jgi:hypothetical protein
MPKPTATTKTCQKKEHRRFAALLGIRRRGRFLNGFDRVFVDEDGFSIYLYSQGIGVEFQESARKGGTVQELDQDLLPHEAFFRVLGLRRLFPMPGLALLDDWVRIQTYPLLCKACKMAFPKSSAASGPEAVIRFPSLSTLAPV